jgi:hypothetical protein
MSDIPTPKGFEYKPIYEPDQKRMVKALRALVEYNPKTKDDSPKQEQVTEAKELG